MDHRAAFAFPLSYVLICQFLRVAVHLLLEIMLYFEYIFQGLIGKLKKILQFKKVNARFYARTF